MLVEREFRKRRLAVAAVIIIALLIESAIWAPFLAHDRPLMYLGINREEFTQSWSTARTLLSQLSQNERLVGTLRSGETVPPASDRSKSNEPDPATRLRELEGQIQVQARGVRLHLGLMANSLPAEAHDKLEQLAAEVPQLLNPTEGPAKLLELREQLRREFPPSEVDLLSRRRWPVIASLHWGDWFFLTASLTLPAWLAWRRWLRHRLSRNSDSDRTNATRSLVEAACFLGLPVLAAAGWWWSVPTYEDRTHYKQGVLSSDEERSTSAPVVYEQVIWPPISYSIDENRLADKLLPPPYAHWLRPEAESVEDSASAEGEPAEGSRKPADGSRAKAGADPWGSPHWLGTDENGRDVLCRMLWGGRVSLSVGIVAVAIYVTLGIIIGAIAGYFRGFYDLLISRVIEIVICFPSFFLILTIVALRGPGLLNIMLVIGLTGWTSIARLIRGEFLRLVDQEFVLAGRALGYSSSRLIFRHILPNAMAPVMVSATFGVAGAILQESALSFLGLGITVPMPSWGAILSSGRNNLNTAPWLILFPGFAIFLTITCYNLAGEALRDAADPRLRGSR